MHRECGVLLMFLRVILTASGSLISFLALSRLIGAVALILSKPLRCNCESQLAFGALHINDVHMCSMFCSEHGGLVLEDRFLGS